ncbi:ABC transporter substrate-binding protein [Nonomuraea sp. NN258]|uniref:ABC transporter substrate-binding protein n=1 Tax=Nonomuraea antri TaxID=2730852 RepID=UPI001569591B|nr:ABC transporter substrate-binding protein [Nonomuraea antri]NRQ39562.1 ABC transporter substrate-binding protein [Nonomuraea antri]
MRVPVRPLVGALLGLLLTACAAAPGSPAATPAADRPAAAERVTIENCGRTLTFDRPPAKVVTGYQPALETLLALGLQDRVAGRTNFSENGPDGFLPGQKPHYDKIPELSPTIMLPQKEIMLAQGADFVLDNSMQSFDAAGGYATVEELNAAGTPVYIMGGWCSPQGQLEFTVEDTLTDLLNLGKIFRVEPQAEALVADLRAKLADVRRKVDGRTPKRVLATDGGAGPVNAFGGAGIMNQLITLAGGVNVLADVKADYTEVSVEKVATSNPESLIVLDYANLRGEKMPASRAKADQAYALVKDSPVAKSRTFLPVPAAAAHPGYRNVLAVFDLAKFLHPDAFPA